MRGGAVFRHPRRGRLPETVRGAMRQTRLVAAFAEPVTEASRCELVVLVRHQERKLCRLRHGVERLPDRWQNRYRDMVAGLLLRDA